MSGAALWTLLLDPEPERGRQGIELVAALSDAERSDLLAPLFAGAADEAAAQVPIPQASRALLARWLLLPVPLQPGTPVGLWRAGAEAGGVQWLRLSEDGLAASALVTRAADREQIVPWLLPTSSRAVSAGLWTQDPDTHDVRAVVSLLGRVTLLRGGLHADGGLRMRALYPRHSLTSRTIYSERSPIVTG